MVCDYSTTNSNSLSWSETVHSTLVPPTELHTERRRVTRHGELHASATTVAERDPVLSHHTVHKYLKNNKLLKLGGISCCVAHTSSSMREEAGKVNVSVLSSVGVSRASLTS